MRGDKTEKAFGLIAIRHEYIDKEKFHWYNWFH